MQKTTINWDEIKQRVNSLRESIDTKGNTNANRKLAVLKERTHALAAELEDKTASRSYIDVVVFGLALEMYAIESSYIREVYPLNDFTQLPGTPSFVFGIINVRGQIISVIDLKKFFNLPEKGIGELNKVIIIRNDRMEFGVLADNIIGTKSISTDTIQTSMPNISGIGSEYLQGITNEHLIILDAKKILEDTRIIVNQETE